MSRQNPLSNMQWITRLGKIEVKDMSTTRLYNTIKVINKSREEQHWGYTKTAWLLSLKTELDLRLNSLSNQMINRFPILKTTINNSLYATRR